MESEQGATPPPPSPLGGRLSGVGDAAANRAKWAERAAFAAPLALILGLALAGGGFGVSDRHVTGIVIWLVVIGLVVLGVAASAVIARPFVVIGSLLAALAVFTALSSFWSASVERSVIEADRILIYLGVFVAAFLIAQPGNRRRRFIEGLALALAAVAVLALASRVLPDVISVSTRTQAAIGAQARLAYPLGYWNADGAIFGLTALLLLWMMRQGSHRALRWIAAGALPAVLLALYFTYSRGGVLTLAVGLICLLALSNERLWHLASFV